MDREQVICLMESATSAADWNAKCDQVKAAYDGKYPLFWYEAIVMSGLVGRLQKSWSQPE